MSKKKKQKNAEPQLSAKKLIETRARNLPLYECYVNTGWQDAGLAHVLVLRRHVNENIAAGVYLVDLKCLGVKDTVFYYNKPEDEFRELFFGENDFGLVFEKIDYKLAHNIVYAGHDFAMDFDIKPHADFATTKFILEEDDDEVPLVDIKVGDGNGKPMLLANFASEYSDALQKLKQHAGEGNYTYIVVDDEDFEDGMDEDEEDFDEDYHEAEIDDYPAGTLGPYAAASLPDKELLDSYKLDLRDGLDKRSVHIEQLLRVFTKENQSYIYAEGPEFDWLDEMLDFPEYLDTYTIDVFQGFVDYQSGLFDSEVDDHTMVLLLKEKLKEYPSNVLVHVSVCATELAFGSDELETAVKPLLESAAGDNPIALLVLALAEVLKDENVDRYKSVYTEDDIFKVFPKVGKFAAIELLLFWLAKVVWHVRNDNLEQSLKNYQLVSCINLLNLAMLPVQQEFITYLASNLIEKQKQHQE